MPYDINTLRKQAEGAQYVSDHRLCLTADGQITDERDPAAVSLLVGAGCSIPVALAEQYGLIAKPDERISTTKVGKKANEGV